MDCTLGCQFPRTKRYSVADMLNYEKPANLNHILVLEHHSTMEYYFRVSCLRQSDKLGTIE